MAKQNSEQAQLKEWVIDTQTGCISALKFFPSPHFNQRPTGTTIDLLVIHSISLPPGELQSPQYIIDFFMGQLDSSVHPYFEEIKALKVSSHLVILRDGSAIQIVPFHYRAWHAGQSLFQGREACNDFSIGIELVGSDDIPFTDAQYNTLIRVTKLVRSAYPAITLDHIVGHSDIAPGRKTDPGPQFDWNLYKNQLSR